jgi:iron complex transport system ATP-binding protein
MSSSLSTRLHILTGPVHSGKTSFLAAGVAAVLRRGVRLGGYLSPAVFEAGASIGYDLLPLAGGSPRPFLRKGAGSEGQGIGPYHLVPEALEKALDIIRRAGEEPTLVVDEIGPLELAGGGVWPAVQEAIARRRSPTLLVIREGFVEPFQRRIPSLDAAAVFGVGDRESLDLALA